MMPRRGSLGLRSAERCSSEPWLGAVLRGTHEPTSALWRSARPHPALARPAQSATLSACPAGRSPSLGRTGFVDFGELPGQWRGNSAMLDDIERFLTEG